MFILLKVIMILVCCHFSLYFPFQSALFVSYNLDILEQIAISRNVQENKYHYYQTEDEFAQFLLPPAYQKQESDIGDYGLYCINNRKQRYMGVFTYKMDKILEKNEIYQLLREQIETTMSNYNSSTEKSKKEYENDGKFYLTKIISGKEEQLEDCVYFTLIIPKMNTGTFVIVQQFASPDDFKDAKVEFDHILDSCKFNLKEDTQSKDEINLVNHTKKHIILQVL